MQFVKAMLQLHSKDQPHQAEVVVAVQVANEDMVNPVEIDLIAHHLHLRGLAAVDHEMAVFDLQQLGTGIPAEGRDGPAGSKDGKFERQFRFCFLIQVASKEQYENDQSLSLWSSGSKLGYR